MLDHMADHIEQTVLATKTVTTKETFTQPSYTTNRAPLTRSTRSSGPVWTAFDNIRSEARPVEIDSHSLQDYPAPADTS